MLSCACRCLFLWISPFICSCLQPKTETLSVHHSLLFVFTWIQRWKYLAYALITRYSEGVTHTFYPAMTLSLLVLSFETIIPAAQPETKTKAADIITAKKCMPGHVHFCSVNNPQNSKNRPNSSGMVLTTVGSCLRTAYVCAAWAWHICWRCFFVCFFFSFSAARQYEERRAPVLGIRENASEHRRDCVSATV